jgi:predicted transcriptional regulator
MKTKNNHLLIKSPKLKGEIVENILMLLYLKDYSISDLLYHIKKKLPYLSSYQIFKKYLVYLADYELISYNGQRHAYHIEENGIDLLDLIDKEKKRAMIVDSKDVTITIERGD